jgi:hypothetical protein
MVRLHIEHAITDLDTWLHAFDSFASVRRRCGVIEERIWQPEGDPCSIVIDLAFESVSAAADFRTFLFERVWSSPESAPALVGRPRAVILQQVATTRKQPADFPAEITSPDPGSYGTCEPRPSSPAQPVPDLGTPPKSVDIARRNSRTKPADAHRRTQ